MTPRPRPTRAPRCITACWGLSVLAGAALGLLGPHPAQPELQSLSPFTVTSYLQRIAGPDARDIRVNGLYGSGHQGAWQFVAHLTWRTADDEVAGGTTSLPQLAGQRALDSAFSADRLTTEEQLGWTLNELDALLDKTSGSDDDLALVDLEIPLTGHPSLISCHAHHDNQGHCQSRRRSGRRIESTSEMLLDQPELAGISVQRLSAPVVP